jgi:hypothetical protein
LDDIGHFLSNKIGYQLIDKIREENDINPENSEDRINGKPDNLALAVNFFRRVFQPAAESSPDSLPVVIAVIVIPSFFTLFSFLFRRVVVNRAVIKRPGFAFVEKTNLHEAVESEGT